MFVCDNEMFVHVHAAFTGLLLSVCQVELFRELQMLTSDYLRQRALYSLQDLVTKYLTEESLQQGSGDHDSAVSQGVLTV